MTVKEVQEEIIKLKKEKDVCILAHAYQDQCIFEVADYIGDSFGLSIQGRDVANSSIIMCGVRFMAETCKVLAPDKKEESLRKKTPVLLLYVISIQQRSLRRSVTYVLQVHLQDVL